MGRVPIERAPSSVTAFLGVSAGGAALIDSWPAFLTGWPAASTLAAAVETYFLAGGQQAWVAPLGELTAAAAASAIESMHPDVTLVAVVADPPPLEPVIDDVAASLAKRRAMLLIEGAWTDAAAAVAATANGAGTAVATESPDAAVYWPRLRRIAPTGAVDTVSPLGAVAGAIAANDRSNGIWTAAAGSRGVLPGILSPVVVATRPPRDTLAAAGVNVITSFPGRATQIWGARTLSADREWRYIPVRRTALWIEESVSRGLDWAASESNDEPLWQQVRQDVSEFLRDLLRDGALAGRTSRQAFFVKCDRSTMTDADIAAGRLVCEIGFAPSRPGEFVVLRIGVLTRTD